MLVAVDDFEPHHLGQIEAALGPASSLARIDRFAPPDAYAAAMRDATIMIGWPEPHLIAASGLEVLQLPSAGYDAYLRPELRNRPSFTLCNARGVMSIAVAEHCLALMLALVRRLPEHIRDAAASQWERRDRYNELQGAVVCIVGLGDIGTEIARRCSALGMRVVGVKRDLSPPHSQVKQVVSLSRLPEVLHDADHVILTVPATPATIGLVDGDFLDSMKPGRNPCHRRVPCRASRTSSSRPMSLAAPCGSSTGFAISV